MIFLLSGEACWWTVHPASKQRSEGEKVRVGDDVIFVSVATERYLVGWADSLGPVYNVSSLPSKPLKKITRPSSMLPST